LVIHAVTGTAKYDWGRKQWFLFGTHHWAPDLTGEVTRRATSSVRQRQFEAHCVLDPDQRKRAMRWLLESEGRVRIAHLLAMAQSLDTIAVAGDDWDRAQMLFDVQNGVIELEKGHLRPWITGDRITKVAPVTFDQTARCPRFERFVSEIFAEQADLAAYLQRVFGYCLTGQTSEQVFWILWASVPTGNRR
jgi:putative DNA primase/helicase